MWGGAGWQPPYLGGRRDEAGLGDARGVRGDEKREGRSEITI
jgi:hypothetical protein